MNLSICHKVACILLAAIPIATFAQTVCEGTCLEVKRQMAEREREKNNPTYPAPGSSGGSQPSLDEQFKETERKWQELDQQQRDRAEQERQKEEAQKQREAAEQAIPTTAQGLYDYGERMHGSGNCPMAVSVWNRAGDMGHARALYRLGNIYEGGSCLDKDLTAAVNVYKRAAALGDELAPIALERLGVVSGENMGHVLYQKGLDASKWDRFDEAIEYWRQSAEAGDADGMYEYANHVETAAEQKMWWTRAAALGQEKARRMLALLKEAGQ